MHFPLNYPHIDICSGYSTSTILLPPTPWWALFLLPWLSDLTVEMQSTLGLHDVSRSSMIWRSRSGEERRCKACEAPYKNKIHTLVREICLRIYNIKLTAERCFPNYKGGNKLEVQNIMSKKMNWTQEETRFREESFQCHCGKLQLPPQIISRTESIILFHSGISKFEIRERVCKYRDSEVCVCCLSSSSSDRYRKGERCRPRGISSSLAHYHSRKGKGEFFTASFSSFPSIGIRIRTFRGMWRTCHIHALEISDLFSSFSCFHVKLF